MSSMPTLIRNSPGGDVGVAGVLLAPLDGRLDAAEAGGRHDEPHLGADHVGRRRAARHYERHHCAEPRVADLVDRWVSAQSSTNSAAFACDCGQAHRQRAQAAQCEERLECIRASRPWNVRARMRRSNTSSSAVTHSPTSRSLWPPMNLVPLCITIAAPNSSGRCNSGVANVESTTIRARGCAAAAPIAGEIGDVEGRVRRRLDPEDIGARRRQDGGTCR